MAGEKSEIQELREILDEFIKTYEADMRGDNDLNGGRLGIIGNIRNVKRLQKDYPTLLWLLVHKTVPTVVTIIIVHVILEELHVGVQWLVSLL